MDQSVVCARCGAQYPSSFQHCPEDGVRLYTADVLNRVGQYIDNYHVIEVLGEGGMAQVYKAEHVALGKPVAIKLLRHEISRKPGATQQFLREARSLSRLRHPNIVDVTDFGTGPDDIVYLVMEYLDGESLERALTRQGPFEVFKAVGVVRQIGAALEAAHDEGIVHRDLKPANIYLTSRTGRRRVLRRVRVGSASSVEVSDEGEFDYVKLLDFGVAKVADLGPSDATRAGLVLGTPVYMAPEQAQGKAVDPRSDIYSLGVLFYEMITGEVPFSGDNLLEILNGHVFGEVVAPSVRRPDLEIDGATNQTILRCLAKDPDERFQSMPELLRGLRDCYTDQLLLRDAATLYTERHPEHPPADAAESNAPRVARLTDELTDLFSGKPGGAPVEAPKRASGRRLTEELAELFSPLKGDR